VKAFSITSDLWRIKFEMNDCDCHLEMTKPGGSQMPHDTILHIQPQIFTVCKKVGIDASGDQYSIPLWPRILTPLNAKLRANRYRLL
jgi:hypothetical protein